MQRGAVGTQADPQTAPPIVHDVLGSPGQPLDADTRAFMEPRFGQDFSHVRVHTDAKAAQSARAVNALAYTVGNQIAFDAGQYQPQTEAGRSSAHELTHTVQQQGTAAQSLSRLAVSDSADAAEQEAERTAQTVIGGTGSVAASAGVPILQRTAVLARAVTEKCFAPSETGLSPSVTSAFGKIAEKGITLDYCQTLGCLPLINDYIDNPFAITYALFLVGHNPSLAPNLNTIIAQAEEKDGVRRPDILTDNGVRREYYEIKPNSASGLRAGNEKLLAIEAFMGTWRLPYGRGTAYAPDKRIKIVTVNFGFLTFDFTFHFFKNKAGLIVYDLCISGELDGIALADLLAALANVVVKVTAVGVVGGSAIVLVANIPTVGAGAEVGAEVGAEAATEVGAEEAGAEVGLLLLEDL